MIKNYKNQKSFVLLILVLIMTIILSSSISLISYYSIEKKIEKNFINYKKKVYLSEKLSIYIINLLNSSDTEKIKNNDFIWLNSPASDMTKYESWNESNSLVYDKDNKISFSVINNGIKRGSSIVLKEYNKIKPYEFIIYIIHKENKEAEPLIFEMGYIKYL